MALFLVIFAKLQKWFGRSLIQITHISAYVCLLGKVSRIVVITLISVLLLANEFDLKFLVVLITAKIVRTSINISTNRMRTGRTKRIWTSQSISLYSTWRLSTKLAFLPFYLTINNHINDTWMREPISQSKSPSFDANYMIIYLPRFNSMRQVTW